MIFRRRRTPHSLWISFQYLFLGILILSLLVACGAGKQDVTPTVNGTSSPTPTPTRLPTLTPTPEPLGSPSNPVVLGIVSETSDPQVAAAAEELARRLEASTRMSVTSSVLSDYGALVKALENGKVHITFMPPLTYLYASQRGLAEAVLLTNHFGVYQYGSEFLANVESGLTPYFDPISGFNSADAATALAQFEGKQPCWVDPLSPSGYIVPAGLLAIQSVSGPAPVFIQSHTAVIRALYIKGICDFGATFAISGDPRTSAAVLQDLPDAMDRVLIIWRTDPVIPNLNVSLLTGLSERNRQLLINSLLDVAKTAEGRALLSVATGNYQVDDLKGIDDLLYDPLRKVVDALQLNTKDMIGK